MLMELTDGSFETNFETFKYNINKFKVKGKKNYNFLTKAGEKFQNIVYKMCRQMFEVEQFPDSFSETTLHMLWKGKGRPEMLEHNRFIQCNEWWPRVAESLVVEDGLKEPLVKGSSIYQIGGQPGHRSEELMFIFKSVVAMYRKRGKMVIVQGFDV